MQTDATLSANNSQHCCVFLRTLLHVVGSCCAKFDTGQTLSYVQTDTTTPNIVGVVASICTKLNRKGQFLLQMLQWTLMKSMQIR